MKNNFKEKNGYNFGREHMTQSQEIRLPLAITLWPIASLGHKALQIKMMDDGTNSFVNFGPVLTK